MKEALKQIAALVERFQRNIEAYRSPAYNETQLRREFIDPFFEALGWDVTKKAGSPHDEDFILLYTFFTRNYNITTPHSKRSFYERVYLKMLQAPSFLYYCALRG
jgi:hypothetical protein